MKIKFITAPRTVLKHVLENNISKDHDFLKTIELRYPISIRCPMNNPDNDIVPGTVTFVFENEINQVIKLLNEMSNINYGRFSYNLAKFKNFIESSSVLNNAQEFTFKDLIPIGKLNFSYNTPEVEELVLRAIEAECDLSTFNKETKTLITVRSQINSVLNNLLSMANNIQMLKNIQLAKELNKRMLIEIDWGHADFYDFGVIADEDNSEMVQIDLTEDVK